MNEATFRAKQDTANERLRAALVTWEAKEQKLRQNLKQVKGGQARKEVAPPGQKRRSFGTFSKLTREWQEASSGYPFGMLSKSSKLMRGGQETSSGQ